MISVQKTTAGQQQTTRKSPRLCATGILLFGRYAAPQRLELTGDSVRPALCNGDFSGKLHLLLRGNKFPEPVHITPEFTQPVVAVGVVGSVAAQVRFVVADDVLGLYGRVVLHQPLAEFGGKPESFLKICAVWGAAYRPNKRIPGAQAPGIFCVLYAKMKSSIKRAPRKGQIKRSLTPPLTPLVRHF